MCGIVGFVGSDQAAENVLDGLRRLEYRGYDSAGIATIADGEIHLHRKKGKLKELARLLREKPLPGRIASATRAGPRTADPRTRTPTRTASMTSCGAQRHHREFPRGQGGARSPGAHLRERDRHRDHRPPHRFEPWPIAHRASPRGALPRARRLCHRVISPSEPDTIVVAKNASPLVIGVSDEAGIIASDIPALLPYTRQVKILEEGELAAVRPGSTEIMTLDGNPVTRESRTIDWSPVMPKRAVTSISCTRRYLSSRAPSSTPCAPAFGGGRRRGARRRIVEAVARAERIVVTACGTSFHAGLVGRLAIEELARVAVRSSWRASSGTAIRSWVPRP